MIESELKLIGAFEPDIYFPLDKGPLFCCSQPRQKIVKCGLIFRRKLKPCQEIEWLSNIRAVMEMPGDRRQIFQADRCVVRRFFENRHSFHPEPDSTDRLTS